MNFSAEVRERINTLITERVIFLTAENPVSTRWLQDYTRLTSDNGGWVERRGNWQTVVFKASTKDQGKVAIKEVELDYKTDLNTPGLTRRLSTLTVDSAATGDFLTACQEAVLQYSKELRHPNIVRCYDSWIEQKQSSNTQSDHEIFDPDVLLSFVDDDVHRMTQEIKANLKLVHGMKFYIVMELYEENLEERYYSENAPTRDRTIDIIFQIVTALKFIVSKKYVHRDLKPRNIFITGLHVALGDFGQCKHLVEDESAGAIKTGTPPYNTSQDKHLTLKWDIWSFGMIVFELFLLSTPNPRLNLKQSDACLNKLVKEAKKGQRQLQKYVQSELQDEEATCFICKCLQRLPDRPTIEDLALDPMLPDSLLPQAFGIL